MPEKCPAIEMSILERDGRALDPDYLATEMRDGNLILQLGTAGMPEKAFFDL